MDCSREVVNHRPFCERASSSVELESTERQRMHIPRQFAPRRIVVVTCGALIAAILGDVARAENPAERPVTPVHGDHVAAEQQPASDAPGPPFDEERRERTRTAAVLLLLGIAATGGLTIVFIVLWGFRVRRNIRKPLPRTRPPDELWYLKPKGTARALDDETGPAEGS